MPIRRKLALVLLLVAPIALAACGGSSSSKNADTPAATLTPAPLSSLAQGLTFTGYLSGMLSSGTGECRTGRVSSNLFQVTIAGEVAGARRSIRAVAEAYSGPGSYGPDAPRRVTVTLNGGAGSAGTLVVDDGQTSGHLDAELTDGEHVSGAWACTLVTGQ